MASKRLDPYSDPYLPGMDVLRSGYYAVVHEGGHKPVRNVFLLAGLQFPKCPDCSVVFLRIEDGEILAESAEV